jgi:citrate synthase
MAAACVGAELQLEVARPLALQTDRQQQEASTRQQTAPAGCGLELAANQQASSVAFNAVAPLAMHARKSSAMQAAMPAKEQGQSRSTAHHDNASAYRLVARSSLLLHDAPSSTRQLPLIQPKPSGASTAQPLHCSNSRLR